MTVTIVTHPDESEVSFFHEDIVEIQRFESVNKPYTKITLINDRVIICVETPEQINNLVNEDD